MIKIENINNAMEIFEEEANMQAEATTKGDYKIANKCVAKISEAVNFLKEKNALDHLQKYFSHPSVGVRMWAAYFLLPIFEKLATKVLEEIVQEPGIHSFIAETTLSEWHKGNIKF